MGVIPIAPAVQSLNYHKRLVRGAHPTGDGGRCPPYKLVDGLAPLLSIALIIQSLDLVARNRDQEVAPTEVGTRRVLLQDQLSSSIANRTRLTGRFKTEKSFDIPQMEHV